MAVMKPEMVGFRHVGNLISAIRSEVQTELVHTWHFAIASLILSTLTSLKPLILESVLLVAACTACDDAINTGMVGTAMKSALTATV